MADALGPDLASMKVVTPADAKIAIKFARLRKKELAADKRELSAQLADTREAWRERTSGQDQHRRPRTRRRPGRAIRMGVQAKRRGERMEHAGVVNSFSDQKQEIDRMIIVVDRYMLDLERWIASVAGTSKEG